MRYLEEITWKVHGRNGGTANGLAPANPLQVKKIARLYGYKLTSLEIDGVLILDAALLSSVEPDEDEPPSDTEQSKHGRAERLAHAREVARGRH